LAFLAILLSAFVVIFPSQWRRLFVVEVPMEKADAIIVLGGEADGRPREAARLYRAGVAPLVFVTGIGDAATARKVLLSAGVPPDRIVVEAASCSTIQNADFSRPLLGKSGVKRALIVTSSFHTRRALATFRKRIPEIEFGVVETRIPWWDTPQGKTSEDRFALIEAGKTIVYWLFYGIS